MSQYSGNQYIGEIELFAFDFQPSQWMYCNGQTLQIRQYAPLFSLIGNRYGGDGKTTFCLPNLIDSIPIIGMHYCIAIMGLYPIKS